MSTGRRLAGAALNEFLGALGRGAEKFVVNKLTEKFAEKKPEVTIGPSGAAVYAEGGDDKDSRIARLVRAVGPENIGKATRYTVPAAAEAGLGALSTALTTPASRQAGSSFSVPVQQQYEAAAALEQMKFDHQMQVIAARNQSYTPRNQVPKSGLMDPMSVVNLSEQIFATPQY